MLGLSNNTNLKELSLIASSYLNEIGDKGMQGIAELVLACPTL